MYTIVVQLGARNDDQRNISTHTHKSGEREIKKYYSQYNTGKNPNSQLKHQDKLLLFVDQEFEELAF